MMPPAWHGGRMAPSAAGAATAGGGAPKSGADAAAADTPAAMAGAMPGALMKSGIFADHSKKHSFIHMPRSPSISA
jgi:hypothetical protein